MELHERKRKSAGLEEGELSDEEISAREMAETLNSYRKRPLDIKEEPREEQDIIIETAREPKRRKTKVKVQGVKDF
uniref:Uncharacterized protein n=2 Tax=Bursaphelenchus xylophilus TaxID=6326 RepID=A0A1I7S1V7_BURXY